MDIKDCRYGRKVTLEDDGTVYTVNHNGPYDNGVTLRDEEGGIFRVKVEQLVLLEERDVLELEAEFERVYLEHHPKIQAKLAEAAKLIAEAENIAEVHGIPFVPGKGIMGFRMSYIPDSLEKKFPDMESEVWNSLTGAHGGGDYTGWQQSQTC